MTKTGKIQESRQNQVHITHSSSVRTNQQTREDTQGECDASGNNSQAQEGARRRFKSTRRQLDTGGTHEGDQGSDRRRQDRRTDAGSREQTSFLLLHTLK